LIWQHDSDATTDAMMTNNSNETQIFSGQLVAQSMLIQILMGQIVLNAADRGTAIRDALIQGIEAIKSNPNMSETENFGAAKTLEDALDTLDRITASAHGT